MAAATIAVGDRRNTFNAFQFGRLVGAVLGNDVFAHNDGLVDLDGDAALCVRTVCDRVRRRSAARLRLLVRRKPHVGLHIVSGTIFAFFALVEWIAGRILEHSGIAVFLVALAAIGVAFSLDALYGNVERFVESTLFRRRHLAERHLASIAGGLGAAESTAAVEDALVREPMQAYGLASAALYERGTSGEFRRDGKALASAVALQLAGARRAVPLHEGDAVLAVPVFALARLEAIVLYGAHTGGEDIDPDETASLEGLARAAGTAYDHLETLRAERDAARWQRVAERQSRELATLRERCALLRPPEG